MESEPVGRFAHHLEVGVPVFFVITGFVLYRPWAEGRPPVLGRYALRRASRIVPAFWVALTVVFLFGLDRPSPEGTSPLVHYLFAQVYSADTLFQGLTVGWSLNVEVVFYAVLPLLGVLLARHATSAGAQAAICAAAVVAALALRGRLAERGQFEFASAVTFDWFFVGILIATLSVGGEARLRRLRPDLLVAAAAVLFVVLGAADLPWGSGGDYTPAGWAVQHVLYGAIGGLLVLAAVVAEQQQPPGGLAGRGLRLAPVAWLGTVSYGIFLWHVPVLDGLRRLDVFAGSAALTLAGVLAVTVPVAALSWYAIERPAMRLTRRAAPAPPG